MHNKQQCIGNDYKLCCLFFYIADSISITLIMFFLVVVISPTVFIYNLDV